MIWTRIQKVQVLSIKQIFEDSLDSKLILKSAPHGLLVDEPLEFQKIIKSVFANSDNKKFPSYRQNQGFSEVLASEEFDEDYFLSRVEKEMEISLKKFNDRKIRLQDTHKINPE